MSRPKLRGQTDSAKQSVYFPGHMIEELHREAARLDRSVSWVIQRCVRLGLADVRKLPTQGTEAAE